MKKIGYARVSTASQSLDRQISSLRAEAVEVIYREKASGASRKNRPELDKAIDALGTGDILVIAEWDRATRSMMDGIKIMQQVADRGASLKVLDKSFIDMTTPLGQGILAFLSALAQDEHERIKRRASDGRKAAKEKGVKFGRKHALSDYQVQKVRSRKAEGESVRALAKEYGVSPATISRV